MTNFEDQYRALLQNIMLNGEHKTTRGHETKSIFGAQLRVDLRDEFPLLTCKKVHFKSIFWELIMFLRGENNVSFLQAQNVTIWDEWAREDGDLGAVYGVQWRKYQGATYASNAQLPKIITIDQLADVVANIIHNPNSRRLLVSAWNPTQIDDMALPPCHYSFQFNANSEHEYLDLSFNMRSTDVFLGLPFNIASYALLAHIVAKITNRKPRYLVANLADAHIYQDHAQQTNEYLGRTPMRAPQLELTVDSLTLQQAAMLTMQDITFTRAYESHGRINAPVNV